MNNLEFYERAIELRNRYSYDERDPEKKSIIFQIVAETFKNDDLLPTSFNLYFRSFWLSQNTASLKMKISNVLHDLGYENCEVSDAYFNNSNTCFSVQIVKS